MATRNRTGVTTRVVEKIDSESKGTRLISTAMVPFVRANNINFEGFDFLPNTQIYPFFDVKGVSDHTKPLDGFSANDASLINGDALVTSASGRIKGVFSIPDPKIEGNPKFRTGEISFRLTSSPTNITSIDPITAGETNYQAVGILRTEQETIIATRNAEIRRTSVSQSEFVADPPIVVPAPRVIPPTTSKNNFQPAAEAAAAVVEEDDSPGGDDGDSSEPGADPLAQTFLVDKSGGIFLTSCDLFFESKDDNLPVTVEIREVSNGFPGARVVPFSRVVKDPVDVTIDVTAQVATNFKFNSLVYLQANLEYCVVVIANVPTYKVWIARLGETQIQSTLAQAQSGGTSTSATNVLFSERTVSKQPAMGVLFKGHNNRTWAPSLTEDLKFNLYRAEFSPLTGTIPLVNASNPTKSLFENALTFLDGSAVIQVRHRDHQMYVTTNNVTIDGVKSGARTTLSTAIDVDATTIVLASGTNFDDTSGKFSRDTSNVYYIKIDDEIITYTTISTNTISSAARGVNSTTATSHAAGATVELYMLHKIPFTEINTTHTSIGNIGIDSYTVAVTSSAVIDSTGTTHAQNGGNSITATENILYELGKSQINGIELPGTTIVAKKRPSTATSPSGSQTSFTKTSVANSINTPLNENVYYDVPYMVASDINQDNEMSSEKSLALNLALTSESSNISPIIDSERMSMVAVANRVNNIDSSADIYPTSEYNDSTEAFGDNNEAVYIIKQVNLAQTATALKVFFDGNKDSNGDIKLLYKILREDDDSNFSELGWRYFNTDGSPDLAVGASKSRSNFREHLYTAGVTDDGLGQELDPFIAFSIKIVIQTTNSASPPRIKNFRAIALAT